MSDPFDLSLSNPTLLFIIIGLAMTPLSGIINELYNKSQKKKQKIKSNPSIEILNPKTEDKVINVSTDEFKTKEEHPMGDKTHD